MERIRTIVFAALVYGRETATAGNERPGLHLITATLHRVNKQIVTGVGDGGEGGGAFGICEGTMQKDIEESEGPETQYQGQGGEGHCLHSMTQGAEFLNVTVTR